MSEIIERVASAIKSRAIESHIAKLTNSDANDLARAAIEAMREPTEAMKRAPYRFVEGAPSRSELMDANAYWHCMIDQALIELSPLRPAGSAGIHDVPMAEE